MSQMLTDEFGQSFQLNESDGTALRGKECLMANIATVASISSFISSSLGPTGMDKLFVDRDGNITVTNDGATILREMDMSTNPISGLILQLSEAQDAEVGDGTTSIVILASALLQKAKRMMEKGIHPVRMAEGLTTAMQMAVAHLRKISDPVSELKKESKDPGIDMRTVMLKAARTTLASKVVCHADFAEMCVDAVLATADMERRDLDMDLIHIQTKMGGSLAETQLIRGILINKEFSHMQMRKSAKNARIALLSCPFEPPRLKNKNSLLIKSADEYRSLERYEKECFAKMIASLKEAKTDVVLCQWGFDDEANSMLLQHDIPAVRWVGGHELGLIAAHISAKITARFEDLCPEALGVANIREEVLLTGSERVLVIESQKEGSSGGNCRAVTILVRGSNDYVIAEAKRALRDALCAVRNVFTSRAVIYGGGSADISASIMLAKAAAQADSAEISECFSAFAAALLEIPFVLAANAGFDPLSCVEKLREAQVATSDPFLGVDCLETGERNMKKAEVFETLDSKTRQLQMATELACMILKINEMILVA